MIAEAIDQNLGRIKTDLEHHGLTYDRLQDDVLDHVCCMLEEEMESGEDFNTAYHHVLEMIKGNTLVNLQHQTLLLLDLKFQRMKNFTYLFGLSTAIIAILGALFKKMHWPGAGILLTVGIGLVILVFLPLYFIVNQREQTEKKNPVYAIVGFITMAMMLASALFKIQHWPGANIMIEISLVLIIVGFLPLYVVNAFQKAGKQKMGLPYVVMVLVGAAVVITFFNVNMSKDVLDVYRAETMSYEQGIEDVQKRTSKLIGMTTDSSYSDIREDVLKIHTDAMSLQLMLKEIQEGMLDYTDQSGVSTEALHHIDNKGAGREWIIDSGKGKRFVDASIAYQKMIEEMIEDPVASRQIGDHLEYTSDVWYWEYNPSMIVSAPFMKNYFKMTYSALGIALSEYVAITSLMHKSME